MKTQKQIYCKPVIEITLIEGEVLLQSLSGNGGSLEVTDFSKPHDNIDIWGNSNDDDTDIAPAGNW